MKKQWYHRVIFISIAFLVLYTEALWADEGCTISQGTYTYKIYGHTLDRFGMIDDVSYRQEDIQTRDCPAIIMENESVRAIVVPSLGGKILSLYDKQTGTELLYTPEIACPYGFHGAFYNLDLYVVGGLGVSFPEAEHGKAWQLPWNYSFKQERDPLTGQQKVCLQLQWKDTINNPVHGNYPGYGETGLECTVNMALYSGRKYLEYEVQVDNPHEESRNYEVCIAACMPSLTRSGRGAHIVLPVDKVRAKQWWGGEGHVETKLADIDGDGLYTFTSRGLGSTRNYFPYHISYPLLSADARWYGFIHPDEKTGLVCVRDSDSLPSGIKNWNWGDETGRRGADTTRKAPEYAKPYVELWNLVSEQFGIPHAIPAHTRHSFTLRYYPMQEEKDSAKTEGVFIPDNPAGTQMPHAPGRAFDQLTFRYQQPWQPRIIIDEIDQQIKKGFSSYPKETIDLLYRGSYYQKAMELSKEYGKQFPEQKQHADQMILQCLLMENEFAVAERHCKQVMGISDPMVYFGKWVEFYAGWTDQPVKIMALDDYIVTTYGAGAFYRDHICSYYMNTLRLCGDYPFARRINSTKCREIVEHLRNNPQVPVGHIAYYEGVLLAKDGHYTKAREKLTQAFRLLQDPVLKREVLRELKAVNRSLGDLVTAQTLVEQQVQEVAQEDTLTQAKLHMEHGYYRALQQQGSVPALPQQVHTLVSSKKVDTQALLTYCAQQAQYEQAVQKHRIYQAVNPQYWDIAGRVIQQAGRDK